MKKSFFIRKSLIVALTAILFSSCEDNTVDPGNNDAKGYVIALRSLGTNNETADYLLTQNDLENAEISAVGKGVEQLGWRYYASTGNKYFSIGYGDNNAIGYRLNNEGQFVEEGKMIFERMDCMGIVDENTFIAIGAPWGGGTYDCTIQMIDAAKVEVTKQVVHPLYTIGDSDTLNKWPTSVVIKDNKMFVSFYPLHGSSWQTHLTDTAYISIYSYPGMEYLNTIKDTRTGPIGYYGSTSALITAENGDIYTISPCSFAAGYTQVTKSSGILRIKDGKSDFDQDYFFDVEGKSGYKLLFAVYAGNGKAIARVVPDETAEFNGGWAAFKVTEPFCKLVVLDLNSLTVTDIADVPMHGGQYATPALVEDGKVYMSINNGTETYIYKVDPETATAVRGAKIDGIEAQAIYKIN